MSGEACFDYPAGEHRVPFDGSFRLSEAPTSPREDRESGGLEGALAAFRRELGDWQHRLYAQDRCALLLIFQALDAAGKDGTIRHVLSGVNPTGCQVHSFKRPSSEELEHDFLWRTTRRLPERGHIGVFNRSYYEEVLVVRVHPELLEAQRCEPRLRGPRLWQQRYASIREHERHLARNGTLILKFWLNVSKEEQRRRFLARIEEPRKHWKFAARDVAEREHWEEYQRAYEDCLNASRPWAPWYAMPADDKKYLRVEVARLIVETLRNLAPDYPAAELRPAELEQMRRRLQAEGWLV